MRPRAQRTIKAPVEFSGVGLHTGEQNKVSILPAPADHGIVFCRVDLEGKPTIPAHISKLVAKERRTSLREGVADVSTVEHLLAALYALQIDNVQIEIDGEEMPGLDGSSQVFAQKLAEVGGVDQKVVRKYFELDEPIYVREGDVSIVALPADDGLTLQYHLDHRTGDTEAIQSYGLKVGRETFLDQVAPARTFVMRQEVEALQAAGLGKGATRQNTLVMGPEGPEENQLRFSDELARHKILDLLGDLALGGFELSAHLIATRSGHTTNHRLVRMLLERMRKLEDEGQIARESGMGIRDILKLLPHRYPFLMVDRVIEMEGYQRGVGIKNVTFNEPFFQGHWPGQPIMPGVLQLEAMAQMAGILLFRKLENTGKLAVLWSIDKVKLRGAVTPGDQLRIEVETIRSRPGLGHVQARCKVAGKLVAEARLMFTLVDA
ncbi:MAG: UDP-3-O-[3-hydroxymyristoyl] N-acetylglucosamine deacetylase [Planctomycetes bacterium]|nr:UDP-3-O-[3-hydroxymyristoyl] N-acetylglucosamine deacetylase [Planctomycetota bacterium]